MCNNIMIHVVKYCIYYVLFSSVYSGETGDVNCTESHRFYDMDYDGEISMHESLVASYSILDVTKEKAMQINCSICTGSPDAFWK